ncbi:hypothetical protein L0666_16590 [Octadecabacter sp. CECT 8868]|uniref:hypothetical protein n=1 Tax=Octadecabacter algicola TaxID=2909342 RepID=UPI001F307BD3|nr:hypothetical protein [Octadecabacter algicola]MCF2906614.1 hypothetical protein [Octadecabacter algicola]
MIATGAKRPIAMRAAILLVCVVAICVCAISVLGIVQAMMRAYQFDTDFLVGLLLPALIAFVALALFSGARKWRNWALWPAVVLFLIIVPINAVKLVDQVRNPVLPAGGFATDADLEERDQNFLSAILRPTEEEYWANRRMALSATFLVLVIVTLPSGVLLYLRRRGELE